MLRSYPHRYQNRGWQSIPFPEAHPWSVPEGSGAMATASCVLDMQDAPVPPLALLGLAGVVLASLGAVTMSKWCSEVYRRRVASARANRSGAVAVADKAKRKDYPEYTIDTVRLHSSAKDAWVVVGDGVYNVTKWAPRHPGGERNIVDISGRYDISQYSYSYRSRVCGCRAGPQGTLDWLRAIGLAPVCRARIALFGRVTLLRDSRRGRLSLLLWLGWTAVDRNFTAAVLVVLEGLVGSIPFDTACPHLCCRSAVAPDRLQTPCVGISVSIIGFSRRQRAGHRQSIACPRASTSLSSVPKTQAFPRPRASSVPISNGALIVPLQRPEAAAVFSYHQRSAHVVRTPLIPYLISGGMLLMWRTHTCIY